ncbi:MAG: hypothetical protein NDI63_15480 [Pseudobdellovibrio sp.]|nr:hypothetical protein [Pseudobdellovibrio sp.]
MPLKPQTADLPQKALIISKNKVVKSIARYILGDALPCKVVRSAPDGKTVFKSAQNIKVLVLDWALQDKYGSLMKCLREAKARKNVIVVNVFNADEQKRWVNQTLPQIAHNNKIYAVELDFMAISLTISLLRVKSRIAKVK